MKGREKEYGDKKLPIPSNAGGVRGNRGKKQGVEVRKDNNKNNYGVFAQGKKG